MAQQAELEGRLVGKISGEFVVKSYQRGYRWGESQVNALLNDIYDNGQKAYCLQPIVVRALDNEKQYELIDGQQRLTTLLIILKFIKKYVPFISIQYSISYETRTRTAEFLDNINEEEAESNIDFYHIYHAYQHVDKWFHDKFGDDNNAISNASFKLFNYLNDNVKVIWYEVGPEVDPIALFARLNIGKIPLTNAELIKAMFLMNKETEDDNAHTQRERSMQWDLIEHTLRENKDEFWGFLTTASPSNYPTRIELLFDYISGKQEDEREAFYTFFYFDELIKSQGTQKAWLKVQHDYLQFKEWYSDMECYHKIGYLIASRSCKMPEILEMASNCGKKDFIKSIDKRMAESIDTPKEYCDLSYDKDYDLISRVLLLFNIQSMIVSDSTSRFPFLAYNTADWTLEHIHAQQSQGLRTTENRIDWIKTHIDYVKKSNKDFDKEGLLTKMQEAIDTNIVSQADFDQMAADAFAALSEDSDTRYVDMLSNMALLPRSVNSILNNSVFAVKRDDIIKLDRRGAFIPFCTKMVFPKYYTSSTETQFEYWGAQDREAYIQKMGETIKPYLELIAKTF